MAKKEGVKKLILEGRRAYRAEKKPRSSDRSEGSSPQEKRKKKKNCKIEGKGNKPLAIPASGTKRDKKKRGAHYLDPKKGT